MRDKCFWTHPSNHYILAYLDIEEQAPEIFRMLLTLEITAEVLYAFSFLLAIPQQQEAVPVAGAQISPASPLNIIFMATFYADSTWVIRLSSSLQSPI